MENREVAIRLSGVKKMYRLGQIGGGSLQADLQSWWARKRGREDPNLKIGQEDRARLVGQSFMALNGIDLTVYQGEALGIIGSNGAGKSTMLKLLSRVTAPTEGDIDIYGRIASMLEVGTGFNGEMTGRENIYMNGAILGMTRAEIDAKIEDIIEFSEVRDFIDTPVKRYSSGMYVKLAFSVAAHLDSEIMIMDEVLAVGDMAFQKKCLDKMRDAANTQGRTVLYVSHNMNTIRQLCDRCIVLDKGKIVFDGDAEEAIGVYMKCNAVPMGTEIDLSQSRMKHLPAEIQGKIMSVSLVGKEEPIYCFKEDFLLDVNVLAKRKINKPCFRCEIRSEDDTPVATTCIHELASIDTDKTNQYHIVYKNPGLISGRYKALLVLYEVNEFGNYIDLDAVWPGFVFDIVDVNNQIAITWNPRNFGYISFETQMGEQEK